MHRINTSNWPCTVNSKIHLSFKSEQTFAKFHVNADTTRLMFSLPLFIIIMLVCVVSFEYVVVDHVSEPY